jgi:hypothetical protein
MVKDFIQRFSGGTDGANVTATTSGASTAGDALSTIIKNSGTDVTVGGDAMLTHSAAAAIEGALGARMSTAGLTANSYASWTIPTGHGRRAAIRIPLNIPSLPAATQSLTRIDTQSGVFSQVKINTAAKLTVSVGSTDVVASTSSVALTPNTTYWLEQAVTIGTTTTNGVVEYQVFTNSKPDGTGVDTLVTSYTSGATVNMGTDAEFGGTASRFRIFIPLSSSGWTGLNTDLWRARVTTDTAAWLGPYVSTLPPTGTGTTGVPRVTLVATPSGGVSPYSYGISHISGPSATSDALLVPNNDNRWTVPVPASADDVWQVLITDDAGRTSDPISYTVAKAVGGSPAIRQEQWDAASATWKVL